MGWFIDCVVLFGWLVLLMGVGGDVNGYFVWGFVGFVSTCGLLGQVFGVCIVISWFGLCYNGCWFMGLDLGLDLIGI